MNNWLKITCLGAGLFAACGSDTNDNPTPTPTGGDVEVSGSINGLVTWEAGKTYILKEHIFVESGVLTIQPGVVVKGGSGTSLVITPGAKIDARGTEDKPIVFTSNQPEGMRAPGDWGGVVLLGRAPINVMGGEEKIEGFPGTESRTVYGGTDAAHDCGKLSYVRIEFAGFELAPDNELNGLTIGACGSATQVDHIQVHKGADDGVEIFGGTVNISHILITQPDDDGLDWDFGWVGRAQFVIVQQSAVVGNCGIEADNSATAPNAEPRSNPELWNITLIGSDQAPGTAGKKQIGMLLRRGTAARIKNALITHFTDFPVDVDGDASVAQANAGQLTIENSVFFDNAQLNEQWPTETDNDMGFDEAMFFNAATRSNRFMDPQLTKPADLLAPSFLPMTGSPMLTGAATPPAGMDSGATFVGAMGAADWTAGWSSFPSS